MLTVPWFVACGPGEPKVDEARESEWAALIQAKAELDGMRQERSALEAQLAALAVAEEEPAEEGAEEGAEAARSAEETQQKLDAMQEELVEKADGFIENLVGYLNADPMIEGEPPTERQLAAVRMKSSEDLVVAQEYIDKGGDYQRAINIYQNSLMIDPDNPELQAALESALASRWMSQERFALAKKGMTQDEIRGVLGQVNLYNVRDYEDRDVTAWFYPTAEGGYAAAVWFKENKKSGQLEAYQIKYDAVSPEQTGE
ncbi:MAG: hypothetical protein OEM62_00780 [Acidobacteriota bacterium]|nr:hypothetical protein [Acidobacteriota bacterium]